MSRLASIQIVVLVNLCCCGSWGAEASLPAKRSPAEPASTIDGTLAEHWRAAGLEPAPAADDAEFFHRLMLDLTGRIPTVDEQRAFAAMPADRRREELVDQLLAGPEFPLHFARVVDDWVQRDRHGDEAFIEWLRTSLAAGRSWDAMFRAMLVGPWEEKSGDKGANRFLVARAKNLDALTSDGSRAFFGVDITCARCHDHPLVADWKQEHYYGFASFFHRTQITSKNGGEISEKKDGELMFAAKAGGQRTALPMFLNGSLIKIDEPAKGAPIVSRRQLLFDAALRDETFFRRSAVNRVWAWFFGRGLVEPIDQMHSGNPASVPKLLTTLADDFAAHGYDLRRLVKQIVTSRAYRATYSHADGPNSSSTALFASAGNFLAPQLKPLTPHQYAMSLVAAIDPASFGPTPFGVGEGAGRGERYRGLEKLTAPLLPELDPTVEGYQAGYREALFTANHELMQSLVGVGTGDGDDLKPGTLVRRMMAMESDEALIVAAYEAVLARLPTAAEMQVVAKAWKAYDSSPQAVRDRVSDLVWALVTSAEFRFNH